MKTNVEFPKKVKNSFIYFQIGLIATMLTVLIVLEFNFESQPKKALDSQSSDVSYRAVG